MGSCVSSQSKSTEKKPDIAELPEDGDLPKEYDPEKYAELLETAINEGDNDLAIKCIQECDQEHREEVSDAFMKRTEKNLLEQCKKHLSATAAFTAELLLRPGPAVVARVLKDSLQTAGESEKRVIEIVCSHPNLPEVEILYEEQFGKTLSDDIKSSECSDDVKEILVAFVQADHEKDEVTAGEWATRLVEASGSGNLFQGEKEFLKMMTTKSKADIKEILEAFLKNCQRDMTVEIEKEYAEGKDRENFTTIAQSLRNPWVYLAGRVHNLLPSEKQDEHIQLLFIVLTQDPDGMKELKQTYLSSHLENLSRDVRDEVQEKLVQRALLKAIK